MIDRLSSKGELSWGPYSFNPLWVITTPHDVPGACPSLYSGGGGPGNRNFEVVGGIARRGRGRWRDHYMELCVLSTWEARPS